MPGAAAALEGAALKLPWGCPSGGHVSPGGLPTDGLPLAGYLQSCWFTLPSSSEVTYVCGRAPCLGAAMSYELTGCVCLKIPESFPLSLLHPQAPSLPGEAAAVKSRERREPGLRGLLRLQIGCRPARGERADAAGTGDAVGTGDGAPARAGKRAGEAAGGALAALPAPGSAPGTPGRCSFCSGCYGLLLSRRTRLWAIACAGGV